MRTETEGLMVQIWSTFMPRVGRGGRKNPPEAQDAHGQTMTARIKQDMERERKEDRIVGRS